MDAALDERYSHHEAHEEHEGFGNYYISISCFVLFVTSFVVKFLFRFWLQRSRAGTFVVITYQRGMRHDTNFSALERCAR